MISKDLKTTKTNNNQMGIDLLIQKRAEWQMR